MYFDFALFFWALLVHLVYDWHWQGITVGVMKGKSRIVMAIHCLTWTMLMCVVFGYFEFPLWALFILGVYWFWSHWYLDMWKCGLPKSEVFGPMALLVDQLGHIFSFGVFCLKGWY